ncbi:MAG: RNA polymerase sigma factor [Bacteroidales bacterium]|nr:RNA polymerase sigma factor [Bacteroidales bacterium]
MTVKEFNKAVDEYSDSLYRFILADIRDEERAGDIVQDTYEKLWRNVTKLDYAIVKSWLFSTAYHGMIDIIRKEKRMTILEEKHTAELVHEAQYSDLNVILHAALERLPGNQKSVILLRDYEGYSYREIGKITGMSEAQVKINIYRGRIALKNFIGKIETVL